MTECIRCLNLETVPKAKYPYNAQLFSKIETNNEYSYCGFGRYCKTGTEVAEFILKEQYATKDEQPIHMSYAALKKIFREYESENWGSDQHLHGRIVFTKDSFDQEYPLESRTYCLSSNNKAFQPNMGGYSIYAGSLDNSDLCVRLEQYMEEECAGKGGWKVDYCYLIQKGERP